MLLKIGVQVHEFNIQPLPMLRNAIESGCMSQMHAILPSSLKCGRAIYVRTGI